MRTIEEFFNAYASASVGGKASLLARFYAPTFMMSTKNEASAFANDQKFMYWLNSLFEFNEKTGLLTMKVRHVDSSAIGDYFSKATVTWAVTYSKTKDEEITFDIHYILNHYGDDFKILLYISEIDQEELMKEKGLL